MKSIIALAIALCAPVAARADEVKVEAGISAKDRAFAADYFESTREKFLASIKGVSEAQWKFKAAPERWSIAECAEHIALTEGGIRGMIDTKLMAGPATPEKKSEVKDEAVIAGLTDRSHKAQAP